MTDLLKTETYNYDLPAELIAQYPLKERSSSRLMVLNRQDNTVSNHSFKDILKFLKAGDVLVLNSSKVFPARLYGFKQNGVKVEIFLLNEVETGVWTCLVSPGKRLKKEELISFAEGFYGIVYPPSDTDERVIRFQCQGNFWDLLYEHGHVPLPPYIRREDNVEDRDTYQTVYADLPGSVAAPTAGFHFDDELLQKIEEKGVKICKVILHVGIGTFLPVKTDSILDHALHSEFCTIPDETARIINEAIQDKRRIIAVGTTTTRTLESFVVNDRLASGSKWTSLFLYPGKEFQVVDALITNFHLPKSSLLMLVSAFAGYDLIMQAYREAVCERYRFFSYGDAMFIY